MDRLEIIDSEPNVEAILLSHRLKAEFSDTLLAMWIH